MFYEDSNEALIIAKKLRKIPRPLVLLIKKQYGHFDEAYTL